MTESPAAAPFRGLVDSHCHLSDTRLGAELSDVLARAREAGVTRLVTVSAELGDAPSIVELASRTSSAEMPVHCAIGTHPHEAAGHSDAIEREVEELATARRGDPVIAIGEIGLDYHYDHSPRETQQEVFARQLRLAHRVQLPVVIHTREAEEDTARILEEERAGDLGGVLHCFTSSAWLARRALDLGLSISFSGIVTFGSAAELRAVARDVPADRLLVETDSPYLAPVPHRGKRCEPAMVRATAELLARERGVSLEDLAATTTAAFEAAFRLR